MRITLILILCIVFIQGYSQKELPSLDQYVGYYNVGVKPNKPFFRSRWYLKDDRLFVIYDSDIDRELIPYEGGELKSTIFLSEEDVDITDTDSTYYLVLNFENEKLQSFRVIRPRTIWPTDLYGYRNDRLDSLAINTEKELNHSYGTLHFRFEYADLDTALVPQVAEQLESEIDSLLEDFRLSEFPLTTVRIYPDLNTYHNAVLTPGAPKWQMGRVWDANEIRMLSTTVAEEIRGEEMDPYGMILHEFIHCIHLSMIPDTQNPVGWLWEGIANDRGCCRWTDNPYELEFMKKGKYPTLKQIERDRTSQMKYIIGPFIVEFIEKNYGWESILDLIKTNGDIKRSLNVSVKQFEKNFYNYLEREYKH